jgi:hypothetical protein
MITSLPKTYKVGSTWRFVLTRKSPAGVPIDLTGLAVRAMFRAASPSGLAVFTATELNAITIEAALGRVTIVLPPSQTVLFTSVPVVVFDIEMTLGDDAWQSPTYKFKTEAEVTRDD